MAKYGGALSLAARGASGKKCETDAVCVIFDATHGLLTNHAIIVRDHLRKLISADMKAVMTEMAGNA